MSSNRPSRCESHRADQISFKMSPKRSSWPGAGNMQSRTDLLDRILYVIRRCHNCKEGNLSVIDGTKLLNSARIFVKQEEESFSHVMSDSLLRWHAPWQIRKKTEVARAYSEKKVSIRTLLHSAKLHVIPRTRTIRMHHPCVMLLVLNQRRRRLWISLSIIR